MADLIVRGGKSLNGEITPAGNKNAALPILCATLLTDDDVTLRNFPDLLDVQKLVDLLISLGSEIEWDKENCTIKINNRNLKKSFGEEGFPLGMRGAVLLLGPLAVRMNKIEVKSEIGGCSLGIRELDPHIEILRSLGANVKTNQHITIETSDGLTGGSLWLDYMSVTTTENFIMAASRARGRSELTNAASEPHVQALCNFLNQMGAKIDGVGSCKVIIEGVDKLHGTDFTIPSDHHEITTLLALGAMTKGNVRVTNSEPEYFPLINRSFRKLGVNIEYDGDTAFVKGTQELKVLEPFTKNLLQKIEAAPWPYFPADLIPLMIALAVKADGSIMFWNKLYEGGFFWIPEMVKFGAHIVMCDPHRVIVYGNKPLQAATVNAPDIIRATVALLMVALTINGESRIKNADSIKRAHPNFIENLNKLGANIEWVE
ncbi:MAG: UDP-N-acetylglucosamine 1-carboxyvinyltransferase [Candidatus Dojkabacteria bacterium]|jgi:UDP-N-acetylglucosamine 1-carboxyvinyltransferase|nr:UDP-N-acetylglucosamine 1-carboxyvinyltransferase [Candidatus Dojkabacteria bacterium]MDD2270024.1 UDP-N-acetylglucosamine 1-carboxyvinyltransferase [Candidatus Dojkabacteria bacterium]